MGQQDYDKILFEAVLNENYKEAAFLLGVGANPNRLLEEHDGVSPFHMAVGLENDNLRFTQLFLKSNANVNIKSDKNWWTPLHVCASWNKPDSMHLLLLNQANPFLQDKNGKTPLDIAVENQSWPCVKILREFIEAKRLKPPHQDKLLSTMTTATATATTSQRAMQSMAADNQNMTEDASSTGSDYTYVEVGGPSNCLPILSLMENDDKSYSNAKTSTFNDSNFDFYLSSQSTTNRGKQPLQQQHESRRAAASHSNSASSQQHASINESKRTLSNSASTSVVNNVNELESLISNLIDIKLKEKTSGLNLVTNKVDQRGSSRDKPTAASSSASSSIRSSRGGVPLPKGAAAAATSASSSRRAMASNSASNLDAGKDSSIKRDHRATTNSRSQAVATTANKSVRSSSNASRSRAATSSGIPLASSSSHTAANTKSTSASTQTRITGKRFYSPEKLPAFHTDSAKSQTNVVNANVATSSSNSNIARQPVPSVVAPLPPPAQSRSNSVASTNRSRTATAPPTMASPSSHKLVDSKTTQTQGRMVKLSDVTAVSSSLSTPPPPPPPPPLPSAPLMSPSPTPMPPSTRAITDQMLAELNVRIRRNETLNGGTGNNNSSGNGCRALATTTTTTTTTTTALSSPFSRAVPEHERTTPIVNRPPPTPHQTSSHHVTESQHHEQQHEEEDNEATAASGSGGFNSRFKNWISKISAPFVTSGSASATNIDGQQQQNEIRFKSSSSVTRLDRSADGSTKQQTASLEQNARFKSNSSTSIFKHEEKLKQKQTVKNDQQKATRKQEVKRRSSSLMSSKKSTSPQSSSQLEQNQLTSPPPQIYSNPNVIEKKLQQQQHTPRMNTHELNNINGMLLRDEIGVQFFHNVLGSSEMINNKFTPVRIIKRSDSVEYEGVINRGSAPLNNRRVVDGPIQPMTSGFIREQPVTSRNLMQSPPSPIDLMTDDYENFDDEITLDEKNSGDSSSSVLSDLNRAGLIDEDEDEDEDDATSCRTLETYRTASDNVNGEYMAMIEDDLRALKLDRKDEKETETTVIQKPLRKQKPSNKKVPFLETENVAGYYSQELSEELDNGLEMTTCSDVIERNMFTCFQSPGTTEWREGNIKSAFNYLLIDPRLTENLPVRAKQERMSERDVLRTFIDAVFYVGKGSRARPYAHLYDACRYWKGLVGRGVQAHLAANAQTKPPKRSKKIDRILSIWEEDKGVVSLHCFQSVIPSEAYTREAAMIDAIGMEHLTNMKKGNYYGEAKEWTTKAKRQLGVVLLKRACAIFMAEGERQIMPRDL